MGSTEKRPGHQAVPGADRRQRSQDIGGPQPALQLVEKLKQYKDAKGIGFVDHAGGLGYHLSVAFEPGALTLGKVWRKCSALCWP